MGINTTVAKLQAFAIGASFAGFAGALLASWQRSVFPENFLFTESINVLAMVIIGGMGSLAGRDLRCRRDRRAAGDLPRAASISIAGVRLHADGADDLPPAGDPGAACLACLRTEQARRLISELTPGLQHTERRGQQESRLARSTQHGRSAKAERAAVAATFHKFYFRRGSTPNVSSLISLPSVRSIAAGARLTLSCHNPQVGWSACGF